MTSYCKASLLIVVALNVIALGCSAAASSKYTLFLDCILRYSQIVFDYERIRQVSLYKRLSQVLDMTRLEIQGPVLMFHVLELGVVTLG